MIEDDRNYGDASTDTLSDEATFPTEEDPGWYTMALSFLMFICLTTAGLALAFTLDEPRGCGGDARSAHLEQEEREAMIEAQIAALKAAEQEASSDRISESE